MFTKGESRKHEQVITVCYSNTDKHIRFYLKKGLFRWEGIISWIRLGSLV